MPSKSFLAECPHCGSQLDIPSSLAGKSTSCPDCRQSFKAPVPEAKLIRPPTAAGSEAAVTRGVFKGLAGCLLTWTALAFAFFGLCLVLCAGCVVAFQTRLEEAREQREKLETNRADEELGHVLVNRVNAVDLSVAYSLPGAADGQYKGNLLEVEGWIQYTAFREGKVLVRFVSHDRTIVSCDM